MTTNASQRRPKSLSLVRCLITISITTIIATSITQAAKATLYKNHRMGDISLAQTQQQADLAEATRSPLAVGMTTTTISTNSSADIVINSIEDELAMKAAQPGQLGNRHRYEQPVTGDQNQPEAANDQQQQTAATEQPGGDLQQQHPDWQPAKIEARNQADSGSSEQQQQEPLIVDHRPSGAQVLNEQQIFNEYASSTQSPPVYSSTAPSSTTSTSTASSMNSYNQQIGGTQMMPQWMGSMGHQQSYFASQPQQSTSSNNQQQQQQQQYGSMMSPSNQVVSVQHPTSINSIISEQQQQGATSPAQTQMATVNGQPTSLILVGQPQGTSAGNNLNGLPQQIIGIGQNGRRVSISNWLRGIGSMLANIFNRREHGPVQPTMIGSSTNGLALLAPPPPSATSSASPGGGNWIQLGPNAPHWLAQAQTAIQQFQQQHNQLGAGSTRFATFIQAPQQQQQQQKQVALVPQMGQQQTNNFQQLAGDLQASASSQLASVQSPGPSVSLTTSQPYPSGALVLTQQGGGPSLSSPAAQAQQQQTVARQQQQVQQNNQAQVQPHQSRPSASQTGESQSTASTRGQQTGGGAGSGSSGQALRLGRSSSPSPSINPPRLGKQNNGGNLPLAHYSQYAVSD